MSWRILSFIDGWFFNFFVWMNKYRSSGLHVPLPCWIHVFLLLSHLERLVFIFSPVTLSKLSSYSECRHALANTPDCFPLFLEVMSKHRHRQVSPLASSCLCKLSPSEVRRSLVSSLPPACLPSDRAGGVHPSFSALLWPCFVYFPI